MPAPASNEQTGVSDHIGSTRTRSSSKWYVPREAYASAARDAAVAPQEVSCESSSSDSDSDSLSLSRSPTKGIVLAVLGEPCPCVPGVEHSSNESSKGAARCSGLACGRSISGRGSALGRLATASAAAAAPAAARCACSSALRTASCDLSLYSLPKRSAGSLVIHVRLYGRISPLSTS